MSGDRESWQEPDDESSAYVGADPDLVDGSGADVKKDETPEPGHRSRRKFRRSEQAQWRWFGWVALIILTTGVAWALILATHLVNSSGDRTAALIEELEEGQQNREAALGQVPQSQKERRALIESQRAETRRIQAEAQAARASQAKDEAAARQALAGIGLAQARARQADAQAILAQAQANRANAEQPSLSISLERQQIDLQNRLSQAIEDLRDALQDLRPGRPRP